MRLGGQNEGNKVALTKGASSRLGRGAVGNNSKPGCVSVRTLLTELFSPESCASRVAARKLKLTPRSRRRLQGSNFYQYN